MRKFNKLIAILGLLSTQTMIYATTPRPMCEPMDDILGFEFTNGEVSRIITQDACVDRNLCPQLSPLFCAKGELKVNVHGFYKTVEGNDCENIQMACVDTNLCPMMSPMLCPEGQHQMTIQTSFYSVGETSCPSFVSACVENF